MIRMPNVYRVKAGEKFLKDASGDNFRILFIVGLKTKWVSEDKSVNILINTNTVKNETMAQVFVLNEAYFKGNMCHILRSKINSNNVFLKYCLESFEV